MILDALQNSIYYETIHPDVKKVFHFIHQQEDWASPAEGELWLGIHFSLLTYDTVPEEKQSWESHETFIDMQYMIEGSEKLGWAPLSQMQETAREPHRDKILYQGHGDFLTFSAHQFVILYPWDAHKPKVSVGSPKKVRKAVFKILLQT